MIQRENQIGLKFQLTEPNSSSTCIELNNKYIIVQYPITKILSSWFKWTVTGELIQNCFPYLNESEREFLISGVDDKEWKELFSND